MGRACHGARRTLLRASQTHVTNPRAACTRRIYQLRKPKTNIQILQQNVLLKQKYLVTFLRAHGPEVFQEIRSAYSDTLSRVLSAHFRSYFGALERLQVTACCSPWRPPLPATHAAPACHGGSSGLLSLGY